MTRRWLALVLVALVVVGLVYFSDFWLSPLLQLVITKPETVQALEALVNLLVLPGAAVLFVVRTWRGWQQGAGSSGKASTRSLRESTRLYLEFLVERYRLMPLLALGSHEGIVLKLPLLDLYVPLTARRRAADGEAVARGMRLAGRALSKDEAAEGAERLGQREPILTLLGPQDGLVVLGDPGAGKSTFLKYLALMLASGRGRELGLAGRLPVLLSLGGYAEVLANGDLSLGAFFARHYRAERGLELDLETMLARALEKGQALVLLDGLDEVKDVGVRSLVRNRVADFYSRHRAAGNKFVVTSRIVGYRDVALVAEGLGECTLLDFENEQIEDFVDRWTAAIEKFAHEPGAVARYEAKAQKEGLLRALRDNPGVRELAANPLLLTILAVMKRQGVSLPERRVELYDNCVKVLLEDWQRARSLSGRSLERQDRQETLRVLAPVALWMQRTAPGAGLAKEGDLRQFLLALYRDRGAANPEAEAETFLAVARASNLFVDRGGHQFGFLHLTFQEYLAAVALVQGAQQGLEPLIQEISALVGDATWREVSRLSVAHLGVVKQFDQQAGQIVDHLLEHRPGPPGEAEILAGLSLLDLGTGGVPKACRERGTAALETTLSDFPRVSAVRRAEAGRVLAQLGDPRKNVTILAGMEFCWVPPGPFLMGSADDDPEAFDDERPQHELDLPYGYWMARFPVTGAQWREYLDASRAEIEEHRSLAGATNEPVGFVTWHEALACCRWLTTKWQEDGLLPAEWQVRLPSEAEWEKAARGGFDVPIEGRRTALGSLPWPVPESVTQPNPGRSRAFPWGALADPERANYFESGIGRPSAVGGFPGGESPYGCEELSGNVWEWTRSLWGTKRMEPQFPYPYVPTDGREVLQADEEMLRVLRGGAGFFNSRSGRCSYRLRNDPFGRLDLIGFRVLLSPFFSEP